MSDLKKYIEKRKAKDVEFATNFDGGYEEFKIGEMLKQARIEVGLIQEDLAQRLHTKKSAISRTRYKTLNLAKFRTYFR